MVDAAHEVGLRTTATIMFGHVERPVHWARHLLALRDLQERTGGFTEFVPLPFVHMEAPLYARGRARKGPTWREVMLMHAVARLVLHPLIPNVQASWVKLGTDGVAGLLDAGVNDLGGTLMNESISRAAGTEHGQELGPQAMEALIRALGRVPQQRTTLYAPVTAERRAGELTRGARSPTWCRHRSKPNRRPRRWSIETPVPTTRSIMSEKKTYAICVVGGTGAEGSGLALRWANAGHRVTIGSRDAAKAQASRTRAQRHPRRRQDRRRRQRGGRSRRPRSSC